MISHGGLTEVESSLHKINGISEEEFWSLPREYQEAFIFYNWQIRPNHQDIESMKKSFLSNTGGTHVVKKKILSFFKKK